ncbi:Cupredoxin [Multifurca ochricompacta]|uniref:Cupredoxin n=1 Tax=Multifurca ochricompacta TaxID=376703 RepID=A0AAD4LZE2_9AGAM|nr:Cupredoxin [Multifurca ochricompacta]
MTYLYHDTSQVLLAEYLSPFGIAGDQGNEPVPDGGYTVEHNQIYRLRLVNSGSFASIRFSIDNHPLTLIEADGTLLTPRQVAGVNIAVAQRYSPEWNFWIRATLQSNMFRYDQPGQNLDIRGVLRYSDGAKTGIPGDTTSTDPGPGVSGVGDVVGTTALTPLIPSPGPNATRAVSVSFSFQSTADGQFLGFMNGTSWSPLSGTSTLLALHKDPTGYAPNGVSIGAVDQLLVTEDSIQVIDVRVDNLDDGEHPFHLHGHRPWIMGVGAGRYIGQTLNATSPLRRDTIVIPAYSWVVLRFVTDNPGVWAFHCHIAWHMAAGLLMQFSSQPSVLAKLDVPQDIVSQCSGR